MLIVDDEPNVRRVLSTLLEQAGWATTRAESGEQALDLVRAQDPDLVLTDLKMPGMDGMELLGRIQDSFPEIPVILLTAHGTITNAVEAMKLGAHDFITKPFDRDEVLELVKKALGQAEMAFVGQTAIVYPNGDDAVAIAKVLRDFNKEHEVGSVKMGLVDGQLITPEEFQSFADLPSRDELVAKVLYLIQYPITGLATALSSILRNFVVVLDAVRQERENE